MVGTRFSEIVQLKESAAPALIVGSVTLTPVARALVIRLPFASVVWNRPTAILVEQNGQTTRRPVRDVTRLVLAGLSGLALALAISASWRANRR